MGWLSKLLGEDGTEATPPLVAALALVPYREAERIVDDAAGSDFPLVAVPIPPLLTLLRHREALKGMPLDEHEVRAVRDDALCMVLPCAKARHFAETRGFDDIGLEDTWAEWMRTRGDRKSDLPA